jgi:hypothetical protein
MDHGCWGAIINVVLRVIHSYIIEIKTRQDFNRRRREETTV